MNQELYRLSTFSSWPETAKASPVQLARVGLYYNGDGDTTVCYRCSSLLNNWKEGDDPVEIHRRRSSNCSVVYGNDKENVPLKLYSDRMFASSTSLNYSPHGRDSPDDGSSEDEPTSKLHAGGLLAVYKSAFIRAQRSALFSSNSSLHLDRNNPDFDLLRREAVRLATFHDWPTRAHAQPVELAKDGFFFTGLDDRVQCAFCRGFLRNWVPGDRPSAAHKKHHPECPFVRRLEVGNVSREANEQTGPTPVSRPI